MTYKGKEIKSVTLEIVEDYIKNKYKPRYREKYDKFTGMRFIVLKILENVIKKLTHPRRTKPINDIESEIKYVLNNCGHLYYTKEYKSYLENEKRKYYERIRTKREDSLRPSIDKIASQRKHPFSHYKEQLQDDKWKSFRRFIFTVRGCKCEMCGATEKLQVHHPNYIKGRKAWEYTCNEVVVLCEQCHRKAHGLNY
jgi:5-methylcytosine-specific restriction endonuclease McrA